MFTNSIQFITEGKNFKQLTEVQKEQLQNRQTELAVAWKNETDDIKQREIFDELYDSLKGYIKNKAYKCDARFTDHDFEHFMGMGNEVLSETLITFDGTRGIPFQPIFAQNVEFAIGKYYRKKQQDAHDETVMYESDRLDTPTGNESDEVSTIGSQLSTNEYTTQETEVNVLTEQLLDGCFGDDEVKRTVVHMNIHDYKRGEIVQAINTEGKSTDSVAKFVNRTQNEFKEYCLNVM